jgi:hypothetical protein
MIILFIAVITVLCNNKVEMMTGVDDVLKYIKETERLDKHVFTVSAMLEGRVSEEVSDKIIELSGNNDKDGIIKLISEI